MEVIVLKENMDTNDKRKLVFETGLNSKINLEYIKLRNKEFIDNPKGKDTTTWMQKCLKKDREAMFKQNLFQRQKQWKDKFGLYHLDNDNNLYISPLACRWFDLINYEKILWLILNSKEKLFNVNVSDLYDEFGNRKAPNVTLNAKLLNLLDNTRNDRSAEIEKLIMKLTEPDENDNNKGDKIVNNDLSDVDDYYLEYAKSEYADRYFFYFSRLRDLYEDMDASIEKKFNKYNSKKTSEIEKRPKLYSNDINGKQQFYGETMQEAQIKKIKEEIKKIKEDWKQQYYKFIFAYMLERPDEIWKLRNIIEDFGSDVQFKFIGFLLKRTEHQNFAYACYKFDDLMKRKYFLFGEKDQETKNTLKNQYNKKIQNLGCNTLKVVNSLLSDDQNTFLAKHMWKSWVGLGCTFGTLAAVIIAPILIQLVILPVVGPLILVIPIVLAAISGILFFDFGNTMMQSLIKAIDFCWSNPITAGAMYSSTVFAAIFWIAVAACVIAVIFWAYKKYMHCQFEKSLKRPFEEKDLSKELNKEMPKENDIFAGLNDKSRLPNLSNSNVDMSRNDNGLSSQSRNLR